jgi:hypothetical protein
MGLFCNGSLTLHHLDVSNEFLDQHRGQVSTAPVPGNICAWNGRTRHVHKVRFPLVPQLANLILREATGHT